MWMDGVYEMKEEVRQWAVGQLVVVASNSENRTTARQHYAIKLELLGVFF